MKNIPCIAAKFSTVCTNQVQHKKAGYQFYELDIKSNKKERGGGEGKNPTNRTLRSTCLCNTRSILFPSKTRKAFGDLNFTS